MDWLRSDAPYSIRMQENTDQKNSKYGHFTQNQELWLKMPVTIFGNLNHDHIIGLENNEFIKNSFLNDLLFEIIDIKY